MKARSPESLICAARAGHDRCMLSMSDLMVESVTQGRAEWLGGKDVSVLTQTLRTSPNGQSNGSCVPQRHATSIETSRTEIQLPLEHATSPAARTLAVHLVVKGSY